MTASRKQANMPCAGRRSIKLMSWFVPVALTLAACENAGDPLGGRTLLSTAVVSDPTTRPAGGAGTASFDGAAAEDVVYIALPPDAIQDGESATIRNRRTADAVTTPMNEGGFDPVAVPGSAGDTVDLDIRVGYQHELLRYSLIVPARRPPIVVRTDPPPRKRDVPLNASLLIVLSEPMDPQVLSSAAIRLELRGEPVAGELTFADQAHLTVAFRPEAALVPATTYHLMITEAGRDLDGDAVEEPVVVEFVTEPPPPTGMIAFNSTVDGTTSIYLIRPDGSALTKLTTGTNPVLSPDGTRLAFAADGQLFMMDTNGSGLRQLTTKGSCPAWAPNGSRIAFSDGVSGQALYVAPTDDAGGGAATRVADVANPACPRWSPDGTWMTYSTAESAGTTGVYLAYAEFPATFRIGDGSNPTWGPDGTRIAFCITGGTSAERDLMSMNPDGSDVRLVAKWFCSGEWSPDGTRLLSSSGDGGIYVIQANGGGAYRLSRPYANGDGLPAWSPDGDYIAFASNRDQLLERDYDLYIMKADGTRVTRLTTDAKLNRWNRVTWGPDPSAVRAP